jgi:uncharacterized protein (DUF58 family)
MRTPWWAAVALLAAVLFLVHSRAAAALLYALVLLWVAARWAVGAAARRLVLRQRVAPTHLTPGQALEIAIEVRNPSPLPLPWLWLREPVPVHLELTGSLQAYTSVPARTQRALTFALRPGRRGRYRVGRIAFRLGDWFGLAAMQGEIDFDHWVTVYPAILPLPPLPQVPLLPTGPRPDRRSPFYDDLASGIRDYQPGDPLRAVAWKATARHGALKVRELPRVRERATTLLLDLHRPSWPGPGRSGLERAISVAASYAWAEPDAHPLGLLSYARSRRFLPEGPGSEEEAARWLWMRPRPGALHRRALLEALAGIDPAAEGPTLVELLQRARACLQPGEALLVLAAAYQPAAWASAARIAAAGHSVTILAFERQAVPCPGVRVLPVSREGDVRWA